MNIFKISTISICIILASCSTHTENKQVAGMNNSVPGTKKSLVKDIIEIDIDKVQIEDKLFLSSIFSKAKVIVLETTPKSLIGRISKMVTSDSLLFLLDKTAKELILFDKEGNFVRRVGQVGKGPGEFASISDFTVDLDNRMIYVLDQTTQRILQYDFGGHFVASIQLDGSRVRSFNLQYCKGVLYCDAFFAKHSEQNYLLRKIDFQTGIEQERLLNVRYNKNWEHLFFLGSEPFHSESFDVPKYIPLFSDTVFSIEQAQLKPYLVLKSKDLITSDLLASLGGDPDETFLKLMRIQKYYGITVYCEFGDYIVFECSFANSSPWVFYNKETQTTRIVNGAFFDDLVYTGQGQFVRPEMLCSDVHGFYSCVPSRELPRFIQFIAEGAVSDKMGNYEKLSSLTSDSNPVLIYYESDSKTGSANE